MSACLVRVDDRLVHGQVVEGWLPRLRPELVVVCSDEAAADETQRLLMRMALPEEVGLEVLALDEAARHPCLTGADGRRALVLVPGPREALGLVRRGVPLKEINIGGLHYSAGRVQLGKAIFLSPEDTEALRELSRRGILLEGRALPGDVREDILGLLGAAGTAR